MQLSDDNFSQVARCFVLFNLLLHQEGFCSKSIDDKYYIEENSFQRFCMLLNGKGFLKELLIISQKLHETKCNKNKSNKKTW